MIIPLLLAVMVASIPLPDATATSAGRYQAGGVQVYRCAAGADGTPAWTLDHPSATLYTDDGTPFARHGAGPSWTATDGSSIAADGTHPIVRVAPQNAGSIPWLALTVAKPSASGALAGVRFVERYDTLGGAAPDAAACTTATVGKLQAVHYSAVYEFFR